MKHSPMIEPLTDESDMPYGKHKGKKMKDVPDDYLLYIYENQQCSEAVRLYISENMDAIQKNIFNK